MSLILRHIAKVLKRSVASKIAAVMLMSLLFPSFVAAQTTKVKGRVTDASTGEGIPFASVFFVGTSIGVSTDMDGYYTLETRDPKATLLRAAMLTYEQKDIPVKIGTFQEVNFSLKPEDNQLQQIVVKPDNRYIRYILKQIEKGKERHNPENRDQYDCEIYNKMELDLTNADERIKSKLLRKNFGFVFNYMDTSVVSGQPYLPIMISETSSHFYRRSNPSATKEIINASKISGINDEATFAQFTGNMHVRTNFYDDFINLFEVMIPSPVAGPNVFYDYYLIDSLNIDGRKTYKLRFHPAKMISAPAFDGEMNVDAEDFAVREIHAKLKKGSNVNWIRDLVLDAEYQRLDNNIWFYKQDKLYADFSITMRDSSKMMSFLGHRQVDYMNPRFDRPMPDSVSKMLVNVAMRPDVLVNDESYWEKVRPYELTEKESNIYKMVDSIKSVPLYKNIYTIVNTIINGYYEGDYVGYGPYFKLFSFNNLEGARFQFGARTNSGFSKKLRLMAYGAYGTKDKGIKGGTTLEYVFNNQPTRKLTLSAKRDVLQLGRGTDSFTEGNIMSSLLAKGNSQKLSPVNDYSVSYQHELNENVNLGVALESRRVFSNDYVPMFAPDSSHVNSVGATQLHLTARFSWQETVTRGTFDKYYIQSRYPILTFDVIGAVKSSNNDYSYLRLESKIQYGLQLPPAGVSKIELSSGRIIGKVPYPFLKLHEGNGTFFFDPSSFACMDFYEFASDTWVTMFWEHNFKGFFLGKIPLMKRLQWREVFTLKAAYGTLSRQNNGITDGKIGNPSSTIPGTGEGALYEGMESEVLFPEGMGSLKRPYIEMGVGVSNIFRVFRVDCFWRMTHRHKTINGVRTKADHRVAVNFGVELAF